MLDYVVCGSTGVPLKGLRRELVEVERLVHRTQVGHVVEPLQPVGEVQQTREQPPRRRHLDVNQAARRHPPDSALERRGGIVQVLEHGAETDQVEAVGLVCDVLDRRQLQSAWMDSVRDRGVAKGGRRLEPENVEAVALERRHRLADPRAHVECARRCASAPQASERLGGCVEVAGCLREVLRPPVLLGREVVVMRDCLGHGAGVGVD